MPNPRYAIAIFWSGIDDSWIAIPPDLEGCSAFGDTPEEALRELEIAMRVWLEVAREHNDDVPSPEWLPEDARKYFEEMKNIPPLVSVTAVEPLKGFVLRLSFDDGSTRETDIEWLLRGPIFEPLRNDPEMFRRVELDGLGSICWPNGADIDPVVLHGSAEPTWKEDERRGRTRATG